MTTTRLCEPANIVSFLCWKMFVRMLNFEIGISVFAVIYSIRPYTSDSSFSRSTLLIDAFNPIFRSEVASGLRIDVLPDNWLDWDTCAWWLLDRSFTCFCCLVSPRTARHYALFEFSFFLLSFKWPSWPSSCFPYIMTFILQYSYSLNGVPSEFYFLLIPLYQLKHALHLAGCCPLSSMQKKIQLTPLLQVFDVNRSNIGLGSADPLLMFSFFLSSWKKCSSSPSCGVYKPIRISLKLKTILDLIHTFSIFLKKPH